MSKQERLIDSEKLKMWILQSEEAEAFMESENSGDAFTNLCSAIFSGELDPDPVPTIKPGDKVRHYKRGEGIVLKVYEDKIIANYNGVSVGCSPEYLEVVKDE